MDNTMRRTQWVLEYYRYQWYLSSTSNVSIPLEVLTDVVHARAAREWRKEKGKECACNCESFGWCSFPVVPMVAICLVWFLQWLLGAVGGMKVCRWGRCCLSCLSVCLVCSGRERNLETDADERTQAGRRSEWSVIRVERRVHVCQPGREERGRTDGKKRRRRGNIIKTTTTTTTTSILSIRLSSSRTAGGHAAPPAAAR